MTKIQQAARFVANKIVQLAHPAGRFGSRTTRTTAHVGTPTKTNSKPTPSRPHPACKLADAVSPPNQIVPNPATTTAPMNQSVTTGRRRAAQAAPNPNDKTRMCKRRSANKRATNATTLPPSLVQEGSQLRLLQG
jgi:hypothetical protein